MRTDPIIVGMDPVPDPIFFWTDTCKGMDSIVVRMVDPVVVRTDLMVVGTYPIVIKMDSKVVETYPLFLGRDPIVVMPDLIIAELFLLLSYFVK